jgi:1,4-alpha-glucan branching enzyme
MATKKKELNGNNGKEQFRQVKLTYHMPDAASVSVAGEFCDWQTDRYRLKRDRNGLWTTKITLPPGRYEYRFVVDGEWHNDPNCVERAVNEFGGENCVLHV